MRKALLWIVFLLLTFSLSAQDSTKNLDLFNAVKANNLKKVQSLLSSGAEVNARDKSGATALMHAVYRNYFDLCRVLLSAGADLNLPDAKGRTAWIWAAYKGHDRLLRLFIENGAAVDAAITGGVTALMVAALQGQRTAVELLLAAGADLERKDGDGKTALDWAREAGRKEIAGILAKSSRAGPAGDSPKRTDESARPAIPAPSESKPSSGNASAKDGPAVVDAPYMSQVEREVVAELNRARTSPAEYAEQVIKPLMRLFRGDTLSYPGEIPIMTEEGLGAAEECYRVLLRAQPVTALKPAKALWQAATDQVRYQGPKGEVGHAGPGGSGPDARIKRYDAKLRYIGENISYGFGIAQRIVVQLLIDDGVPSRGHRENILNPNYDQVGVAVGEHLVYNFMCVVDFASLR